MDSIHLNLFRIMNSSEKLCLQWNDFKESTASSFGNLREDKELTDVTLVCEDKTKFKAHKFVLNACSPVFEFIIDELPQSECSVIYLRGIFSPEMKSLSHLSQRLSYLIQNGTKKTLFSGTFFNTL